ncbi:hypothetical protein RO3G_17232 [Rhizopus delemar RA 99-880]|uniref:Uncharacterized protein n=1 Tax=Rhizopus delemar (strain RA 99-880 / ATCC MYA-4621 / FGSC 9543 / NRRL 43880) TaxID=246409 RepID=I1CV81_RHIO9|nr:hypothetical protein RO3G_17232 [Rhizopus delemar RA 99-880]|eukprot:EIE92361.1 hypothetical protein RO3G_17232 [Rhizopus delemar RA 99-880]
MYAAKGPHPFTPALHNDIDASPFLQALNLIQDASTMLLTTKSYRRACVSPQVSAHRLTPSQWSHFWKFPLSHHCRNRTSWSRFTNPTEFNVDRVKNALFCLKFPPKDSSSSQGPPSTIIGHTLMGIWRAHWAFIFDSVPFHPDLVSKSVSSMITTSHKENLLLSGCSPVPLPHIQP